MATKGKHKNRSKRSHRASEQGFNTMVRKSIMHQLGFMKGKGGK